MTIVNLTGITFKISIREELGHDDGNTTILLLNIYI